MRRDGFVSMRTDKNGFLLTRKIKFDGKYLFIYANISGDLKVEILDENGNMIKGYSKDDCISFSGNSTKQMVSWKNKMGLEDLKNRPLKFRFYLSKGEIYSFWVSPYITGESLGYTGGPGLDASGIDKK